jgi:hypothetical protein
MERTNIDVGQGIGAVVLVLVRQPLDQALLAEGLPTRDGRHRAHEHLAADGALHLYSRETGEV